MKTYRRLAVLFLLISMLAVSAVSAFAAEPSITLLGVDFISGKGLVLYFNVGPDFDASQGGSVVVDGVNYTMACHFNDSDRLVCIADVSKATIGSQSYVTIGGSNFDVVVPEANVPVFVCSGYTYNVFDYGPAYIPWGVIGTYNQPCPASTGDQIYDYYNPNWDYSYDYVYGTVGSDYCAPELGGGYYYDNC
jgi:hypothetical protein